MSTGSAREWWRGDSDPGDQGLRVRDCHGDVWTSQEVLGLGVRIWSTPETKPATWDYLLKKWGPVTEVLADSLGVSGEDRSDPTPAPGPCTAKGVNPEQRVVLDCQFEEGHDGSHQQGDSFWHKGAPEHVLADLLPEVVTPEGTP